MVALAAGTYEGSIELDASHDGLRIVGRCPELVTLRASEGEPALSIDVSAAGSADRVELSGFTLTGGEVGLALTSGAVLVDNALFSDNHEKSLFVDGHASELDLRDVQINDTAPDPSTGYGIALLAGGGGSISLTDVNVSGCAGICVALFEEFVTLDTVHIRDTVPNVLNGDSGALYVEGGSVTLTGLSLADNTGTGIVAVEDAEIQGTDIEVSGTLKSDEMWVGEAIWAEDTTLTVDGLNIHDNEGHGLAVARSAIEIVNAELRNNGAGGTGCGIYLDRGSSLNGSNLVLEDNATCGLAVVRAEATLRDVTVAGTCVDTEGVSIAVAVNSGDLTADNLRITNNAMFGLLLGGGTNATVSNLAIEGNGSEIAAFSTSVGLTEGSTLTLEEGSIRDSQMNDIFVSDSSVLELSDVNIEGTVTPAGVALSASVIAELNSEVNATRLDVLEVEGVGLYAFDDSVVVCTDCTVSGAQYAGALAVHDAGIALVRSVVTDVTPAASLGGGVGVAALGGDRSGAALTPSALVLIRCSIDEVSLASAYVEGDGTFYFERSDLSGGSDAAVPSVYPYGNAVFATGGVRAWDESAERGLYLLNNTLHDSQSSALFLDASTATLAGNTWTDNVLDLTQQRCDDIAPPEGTDEIPEEDLCPADHGGYDHRVEELTYYLTDIRLSVEP